MSVHTPSLKAALLLKAWKDIRNRALLTLDLNWARSVPGAEHVSADVLLTSMHKARYECTALPDAARHESRVWLQARGFKRFGQQEFLPEDQLPR